MGLLRRRVGSLFPRPFLRSPGVFIDAASVGARSLKDLVAQTRQ